MAADETRAPARLLEYQPGACIAFAPRATIGLVPPPAVHPIPGAPAHCPGLFAWEGRYIPLIDMAVLLDRKAATASAAHALVLAWQPAPREPLCFGAVCAPLLVRMVQVGNAQWCELPGASPLWPRIARSCFTQEGKAVPIVDTALLFGQPLVPA